MSAHRLRLVAATLMAALLLAACADQAGFDEHAIAVMPDTSARCFYTGLRLADMPGPKAQLRFAGEDAPRYYADTIQMFHVLLAGRESAVPRSAHVQDMSASDWYEVNAPWIDARSAFYVRGASLIGPLGPTLASFATQAAAERFAAEHGGTVLDFAAVDADMVVLDGGALHDTSM